MNQISDETIKRLPNYLRYLEKLQKDGETYASSADIALYFKLNPVAVRKDLAAVSSCAGVPKKGFLIESLIDDIILYMGLNNNNQVVLVGAGKLGQALLGYKSFKKFGLEIIAAFDNNPLIVGKKIMGKPIFAMNKLEKVIEKMEIKIAIVCVPKESAQEVVDVLIKAGVKGIWNFAPTQLKVSDEIVIKQEDMAASLAILSQKINQKN